LLTAVHLQVHQIVHTRAHVEQLLAHVRLERLGHDCREHDIEHAVDAVQLPVVRHILADVDRVRGELILVSIERLAAVREHLHPERRDDLGKQPRG
jgi:hypothetical protein